MQVSVKDADKWFMRWPRSTIVAGLSCLILLAAGGYVELRRGTISRSRVYRIGYDNNPPLQIIGDGGKLRGFAVDTVDRAAQRAGIKLLWLPQQAFSPNSFRTKSLDLWPLMADLPERREFAYISEPWIVTDAYLITRGTEERLLAADYSGSIRFAGPTALYTRLIHTTWPMARILALPAAGDLVAPFCTGEFPNTFVASHQMTSFLGNLSRDCPAVEWRARHLPRLTLRLGVASTPEMQAVADRLRSEIMRMGEEGELGGILAKYAYIGFSEAHVILQLTTAERQSKALRLALTAFGTALVGMVFLAWRLGRARKAADKANASKSEFLANMSHEIRTPLGGVIGMVELTLDTPVTDIQRDYLETARSSAAMLLTILNDVLDFSRIEAGRIELSAAEFDVRRMVTDVGGLMAAVPRAVGVEFRSEVAQRVPALHYADAVRVRQVLVNLIGNAVKFTERGSVILSVDVADGDPGSLVFQVCDTGIGIPAGKHQQVFEPLSPGRRNYCEEVWGLGTGPGDFHAFGGVDGWADTTEKSARSR